MPVEIRECYSYLECAMNWTEKHAGLGGWVGAIGAILAIFVTWGIARAEYTRERKRERTQRRAEIDQIKAIVVVFQSAIDSYKKLGPHNPEAMSFENRHINDPEWHSMTDLATREVTLWPNLELYTAFKRYWFNTLHFLQLADAMSMQKAELYRQAQEQHDETLSALMDSLERARKG